MKKVENKTAKLVAAATIELLLHYKDWVFTITGDRGKEFSHYKKVAKALESDYYFATPYSLLPTPYSLLPTPSHPGSVD